MKIKTDSRFLFLLNIGLVVMLLIGCTTPAAKPVEVDSETWDQFEAELESLRQEMKIPGMSAAVVKDGQLVWAHGLGAHLNRITMSRSMPDRMARQTRSWTEP